MGASGRRFTDSQRRAMFMNIDSTPKNSFSVGESLAVAAVSAVQKPTNVPQKSNDTHVAKNVSKAASPISNVGSSAVGVASSEFLNIGEPYMPTNSEWIDNPTTEYGGQAYYSMEPDGNDINIERVRWALKKQYPDADVDTKVTMLLPGKYMETALRENPGREDEASKSNGFYSPKDDKTYLEIDTDGLNTVRAMIHEFVHDMSDNGVGDDMLNEGYADYVAYKIMIDELNIPETRARVTLGYPDEEKKIERLVDINGRKKVDAAFLKDHSLSGLSLK